MGLLKTGVAQIASEADMWRRLFLEEQEKVARLTAALNSLEKRVMDLLEEIRRYRAILRNGLPLVYPLPPVPVQASPPSSEESSIMSSHNDEEIAGPSSQGEAAVESIQLLRARAAQSAAEADMWRRRFLEEQGKITRMTAALKNLENKMLTIAQVFEGNRANSGNDQPRVLLPPLAAEQSPPAPAVQIPSAQMQAPPPSSKEANIMSSHNVEEIAGPSSQEAAVESVQLLRARAAQSAAEADMWQRRFLEEQQKVTTLAVVLRNLLSRSVNIIQEIKVLPPRAGEQSPSAPAVQIPPAQMQALPPSSKEANCKSSSKKHGKRRYRNSGKTQ